MGEHQYVFSHTADASERERLRVREQLLDAWSQRYLNAHTGAPAGSPAH